MSILGRSRARDNPPMQWTEPAGTLLVSLSRRGAGSATHRPHVATQGSHHLTVTLFKPRRGSLDAHLFDNPHIGLPLTLFYRIEIPLEPFDFQDEPQETSVRMDFIKFAVSSWRQLPGREFRFPVNPEEGYIDGSIYLGHAHNPADTTRIAFGDLNGNVLTATFDITFDFTFEGGASKLGVFSVSWPVELECSPSALDALVQEADGKAARR